MRHMNVSTTPAIDKVRATRESVLQCLGIATQGINTYGNMQRWNVELRVRQDVEVNTGLRPILRDDFFKLIETPATLRYLWHTEWTVIASAEADTQEQALQEMEPVVSAWLSRVTK